jgi:PKD repeat protein
MLSDLPPPVDGIAPPPVVTEQSVVTKPTAVTSKPFNRIIVIFLVIAVLYAIPAFVFMGIFPRADGSMATLKQFVTLVYSIGTGAWVLIAVIGLLRVSALKDHPRMKFFGMVRLIGMTVPMVIIGSLLLLLINIPPKLRLEVLSPTSTADFIAPVSMTFGMRTALLIFKQQQLTPLKFEWDYNNDGIVDQETFDPTSTYIVKSAGIFNIVCTVTMTNGQKKNVIYRLIIPRASFEVQPVFPIIDEQLTFSLENFFTKSSDASVPKLLKARWDFDGDGTVDMETDKTVVSYTYHKLGKVNVVVTMTQTNQTQTSLQRVIEINKAPEQPFPIFLETEPSTLLGPPPFGVLFTIKTSEPIASASWDFGNQKSGEGLRIAQVFNTVGSYSVIATVRSLSGAIAKLNKVVRVTNPLDIRGLTFEGSPVVQDFALQGEVPLSVNLTPVTSQPLISFTWDASKAPEAVITDKTFQATYRDEGRYTVDLIGIDPDQNVFRKTLTITALPAKSTVVFSMDPPTPSAPALVKFDASDTFVPPGDDITGFEWDFGDNSSGGSSTKFSGARIEHLYQKPGTYSIQLTVRTIAGKSYIGRQTLLVRAPLYDVCFVPSRLSGKAPLGVRFDSGCSTGNFTQWLWDFDDNAQSDIQVPTHVFLKAGEYSVTLTGTTKDGLKGSKTTTITVTE